MTTEELNTLLAQTQKIKAETQPLELKAVVSGCPTRLYDTLSSVSNQDDGGVLLFGVDEKQAFAETGVYDAQNLMKHVGERCGQMTPAVREAILNALVHRDYSLHTEGMPIQLLLYRDRFELRNPGGLYGRIRVDQLGKVQPDTRNPVLAVAMEVLNKTENRYSGIPTIRRELSQAEMPSPEFRDERGSFIVCFH